MPTARLELPADASSTSTRRWQRGATPQTGVDTAGATALLPYNHFLDAACPKHCAGWSVVESACLASSNPLAATRGACERKAH